MRSLVSYYALSFKLAFYIALIFSVIAAIVVLRSRDARHATRSVSRVLAVGSVFVIFVATGLPRDWPLHWGGGDLKLALGEGGLGEWRHVINEPNSLAALLIVLNVVLYIPLAFLATLGWRRHVFAVLVACLLVSLGVEFAQLVALNGVAATDDVLLNFSGAVAGAILGVIVVRRPARPQPAG
ncbi:MAG: VanZ family protein [Actinomycetota bacterium]